MTLNTLQSLLSSGVGLGLWLVAVLASLVWLVRDLHGSNAHLMSLMKGVWILTVAYSGPLGLLIYHYSGRRQIARDSLWRRAFRSTAHCYSGCGAGEILGVMLAAGLLAWGNVGVAVVTFLLAYLFGYFMTVGPLVQEGVSVGEALRDAFYSETGSIVAMEATAIGVDLWIAADAVMGDVLFWSSLIVSLSLGLVAAYPVNVLLIRFGIKKGMHDPRQASHAH